MKLRTTKTSSNKTAVQVVEYSKGKTIVIKHIGSAKNLLEVQRLSEIAKNYIIKHSLQLHIPLFKTTSPRNHFMRNYEYLATKNRLTYEILSDIYDLIGFNKLSNTLLKDLAVMRIVEPSSKLRSIELLSKHFDIVYPKNKVYRSFNLFYSHKSAAESISINFASSHYGEDLTILFYDVTTLYFENFKSDQLRDTGFSKDNKFNQPQIVIGLIVTNNGFPVSYQLFNGSKYEGHTMIPAITRFIQKTSVKNLTVVADAAMISKNNIDDLIVNKLKYIVGARLYNLKLTHLNKIFLINKQIDDHVFSIQTENEKLIIHFSKNRFNKDKSDLEKQIKKSMAGLTSPSTVLSRFKYIKKDNKDKYILNNSLIKRNTKLLGLKGYYTNSKLDDRQVIEHYCNLWKVEKAFRMAKSDLQVRPVYHWKPNTINSHILLCFVALCIAKHIELSSGVSVKRFVNELNKVTDATLLEKRTREEFCVRTTYPQNLNDLIRDVLK